MNRAILPTEFPNNKFIGFDIRKDLISTDMMLFVETKDHKTKKLYFKKKGLTYTQIFELRQSLQHVK